MRDAGPLRCATGNAGLPVAALAHGVPDDTMDQDFPQLHPAPPMSMPPALPSPQPLCRNGRPCLSGGRSA